MPQFPTPAAPAPTAHNQVPPATQWPDGRLHFHAERISEVAHGDGPGIQPIELIPASHEPQPLPVSTLTPWEPQPTRYEITWHDFGMDAVSVHPSVQRANHEIFSPVRLHRSVDHGAPAAFAPDVSLALRDIAGSPLSHGVSTASDAACDARQFLSDVPLSPAPAPSLLSSDRPRLHLPTPEFDSTHQVTRVPAPRLDMLQMTRSAASQEAWRIPLPSMAIDGGSGGASRCTDDCGEWQMDAAAADGGWVTPERSPRAPNSAPAVLYGSTTAPREHQAALADIDGPAATGDNDAVQVVGSLDALPG